MVHHLGRPACRQASIRTYLTSTIDPKEKSVLIVAISYFKKEEQQ